MDPISVGAAKQVEELAKAVPAENPYPWLVHYDKGNGCLIVAVKLHESAAVQKAIELLTSKAKGGGDGHKQTLDALRREWDRLDGGQHDIQQQAVTANIEKVQEKLKRATGEEY